MRKIFIALVSIILILGAVAAARILIATAPKAERKRPPKTAPLVETRRLSATNEIVEIQLTGTVVPAEEISLRPRISGEVTELGPNFIDGGLLEKGETIVALDAIDYELALTNAQSKLETARFDYKQELGRQDVARREWELLKSPDASELEKELALRKPHLAAKKAALAAAESAVEQAELNMARTRISAPFNALVLERSVNLGSQASLQTQLAALAGTDAYWIEVSIPVDRIGWVAIPGSRVKVASVSGTVREGHVIKMLGDLEPKGRMARLLVEVRDPLCLRPENQGKTALILGEFVRATVFGRQLENIYSIPRSALHEDRYIWIAKDGKLDVRPVDILWRDTEKVIFRDGVQDGVQLVLTDINAPVNGMDLNTGRNGKGKRKPANKE